MLCGTAAAPPALPCFNGSPYVPIPWPPTSTQHALSLLERPEVPRNRCAAEPSRPSDGRRMSAAHLLGYVAGRADEVTGSEGRLGDADLVGRSGLEAEYDQVLRGTNGRSVVSIDPRGAVTGTLRPCRRPRFRPADPPRRRRPAAVEKGTGWGGEPRPVRRASRRHRALPVVIDVTSALSSLPRAPHLRPGSSSAGSPPQIFAGSPTRRAEAALRSRIIAETYPPASTFKVISVPAAVSAEALAQGHVRLQPGYRISDHVFNNFESRGHGRIDLHRPRRLLRHRVLSPRAPGVDRPGWHLRAGGRVDPFVAMARSFGLGRATEWTSRRSDRNNPGSRLERSTGRRRGRRPARGPGPAIRSWPGQTRRGPPT